MGDSSFAIVVGAIIVVIFILMIVHSVRKRKKNTTCKKCKTKYNYETDVSWREISRRNVNSGNKGSYFVMSKVEFNCRCHKCGSEKTFTEEFKIYSYNADRDKAESYDLTSNVEKYFS